MHNSHRVALGAATAMTIGSLCPWASALGLAQVNGLGLECGWITLLAGCAIALLELDPAPLRSYSTLLRRHRRRLITWLAVCGVAACMLVLIGLGGGATVIVGPAWGLYVTLLASLVAAWAARGPQRPVLDSGAR